MLELLDKIASSFRKAAVFILVVGMLGGAVYMTVSSDRQEKAAQLETRLDKMLIEVERLEKENNRLKILVRELKDSEAFADKVAREDAGLIGQGELLYVFPH